MNFNLINVAIADMKISKTPDVLRTILGSCVGICLYDTKNKQGGLSHIMLPNQRERASSAMKYADTAIPLLIEKICDDGANIENLEAKIVGGATMFNVSENSLMSDIGKNNIAKVKEILDNEKIKLVAEDVGGNFGRTIDFYLDSGQVKIKSVTRDELII